MIDFFVTIERSSLSHPFYFVRDCNDTSVVFVVTSYSNELKEGEIYRLLVTPFCKVIGQRFSNYFNVIEALHISVDMYKSIPADIQPLSLY